MRLLLLAAIFSALALPALAQTPGAREAYVERRGLLVVDERCQLFAPDVRAALNVGLAQARGALLRAGWSNAQVGELERATVSAARARACTDPRTASAAEDARHAFANWINLGTMEFPGWARTWVARRVPASDQWRLSQAIDTLAGAEFGVRDRLTLVLAAGEPYQDAELVLRDARRANFTEVGLPQRMAYGLEAGAPPPSATQSFPATRRTERSRRGRTQQVFEFPDGAFAALLALDPRESVEIRLTNGRAEQRLLVEVGDIAAARAFLTTRP